MNQRLETAFIFILNNYGIIAIDKAHTGSAPSLSSLRAKVALGAVPIIIEHRSLSTLEGGTSSATSFLGTPLSTLLQAIINAVVLLSVVVWKVSQTSQHFCLIKL